MSDLDETHYAGDGCSPPHPESEAGTGAESPADEPMSQTLVEALAAAGVDVSGGPGGPEPVEDQQTPGASGAMSRDEDLSHPEDDAAFQGSYRLTDLLAPWFAESVQRWDQGEQIVWDISVMGMPDPNNRGMWHPGLAVSMSTKGAVANSIIYYASMEQPFGLNREVVDAWCKRFIADMLAGRSEQLAEMETAAKSAFDAGRQPPTSGLIVPGR